jgi:exopolysaccharide biosynthesis WecB/TagA/CpsF family protein
MSNAWEPRQTGSITFYMHDFSGAGVERMRLALAAEFRLRAWRVTIIVNRETGPLVTCIPKDVDLVVTGRRGVVRNAVKLTHIVRRIQPDVLVSSLDHNNIAALLAGALGLGATRVFLCQHNFLSRECCLGWKYRLVPVFYWLLSRWASGIIAVSDGVAADLATVTGISRSRIRTIYNPVLDADFALRASGTPPHRWLAKKEGPVFIFAGRLVEQKDPQTLLRAFALLENQAARLILLGEGPLRDTLVALAAELGIGERVLFAGHHVNPLPWMAHADALVLSSRYEGFGNVIVESLGCGTPVIATDCCAGPAEILNDPGYGRLTRVGDESALADAMAAHRKSSFSPAFMQRRAAEFTVGACVDQHLALFCQDGLSARTIFGLRFARLHARQVVRQVLGEAPGDRARLVVTPNADHIRLLRRSAFAAACRSADIICADGFPVALYAWMRGLGRLSRVTGCDILHFLLSDPALSRHRVFLVAESPRTVLAWAVRYGSAANMQACIAPACLIGQETAQVRLAQQASAFGATIVIVALGAPVSEIFVHRQRSILPPCWALCVGQAVRVELGLVTRAPRFVRAIACEWLWRLLQEPRRMVGRYAKCLIWFPVAVARDLLA